MLRIHTSTPACVDVLWEPLLLLWGGAGGEEAGAPHRARQTIVPLLHDALASPRTTSLLPAAPGIATASTGAWGMNESATYNNHACLRFTYIFVARIHGRLSCHAPVGRLRLTVDRFLALGIYRYPEMICYDTPAAWAHNDDMLWLCVSPFHLSQSINSPLWRH